MTTTRWSPSGPAGAHNSADSPAYTFARGAVVAGHTVTRRVGGSSPYDKSGDTFYWQFLVVLLSS